MTIDGRMLDTDVLVCRLDEERVIVRASTRRGTGPTSRTLIKNGPLSVTLVSLGDGGSIKEHQAAGPITVHVLHGDLRFITSTASYDLTAGDLLSLGAGIRHSVESKAGAQFLITIALPVQG
jgi:quercetin dioxygenase-like cupin family protein